MTLTLQYRGEDGKWHQDLNPHDFLGQQVEHILAIAEGRDVVAKIKDDNLVEYLCGTEERVFFYRNHCRICNTPMVSVCPLCHEPIEDKFCKRHGVSRHCPRCSPATTDLRQYQTEGHQAQTFRQWYDNNPEYHGKRPYVLEGVVVWG